MQDCGKRRKLEEDFRYVVCMQCEHLLKEIKKGEIKEIKREHLIGCKNFVKLSFPSFQYLPTDLNESIYDYAKAKPPYISLGLESGKSGIAIGLRCHIAADAVNNYSIDTHDFFKCEDCGERDKAIFYCSVCKEMRCQEISKGKGIWTVSPYYEPYFLHCFATNDGMFSSSYYNNHTNQRFCEALLMNTGSACVNSETLRVSSLSR